MEKQELGKIENKTGYDPYTPLRIAATRYWHKPMAVLFNALQLRALSTASFGWNDSVLDVGCNDGECGVMFTEAWGPSGSLIGVDVAKEAIESAGEKARKAYTQMVHGSATDLPFEDGQFRAVISNASLLSIAGNLEPALNEMARVLQPEGDLAVTVCTDQYEQHYWITKFLTRLGLKKWAQRYTASMNRRMQQVHLYSPQEWCRQLEAAGFEIKRCVGFVPLDVVPLWSFLAWTPMRVIGILKWVPNGPVRRGLQTMAFRCFKPLYDRIPREVPAEASGYILIEAQKAVS